MNKIQQSTKEATKNKGKRNVVSLCLDALQIIK